jgi:hypothetical protein
MSVSPVNAAAVKAGKALMGGEGGRTFPLETGPEYAAVQLVCKFIANLVNNTTGVDYGTPFYTVYIDGSDGYAQVSMGLHGVAGHTPDTLSTVWREARGGYDGIRWRNA